MKNSMKVLLCVVAVFLLIVFWFVGTKNNLVSLKENVELQWAQVETALQRRSDLIPNLVATVQGYADHEEQVLVEVTEARTSLLHSMETGDIDEINEAYNELELSLDNFLYAVSESYPDLQASEQFIALQDELAGTENRISVARQYYNEAVNTYNVAVQRFPASMVANMSGYSPMPYFEADESAHDVPQVSFD